MAAAAGRKRPRAKSDCASRRSRPREGGRVRDSADASAKRRSRSSSSTRAKAAIAVDGSVTAVCARGGRVGGVRPREPGVEIGRSGAGERREDRPRFGVLAFGRETPRPPVLQAPSARDVVVERRKRLEARARRRPVPGCERSPRQFPERLEALAESRSQPIELLSMGEGVFETVGVRVQSQQPLVRRAADGDGRLGGRGQGLERATNRLPTRIVGRHGFGALAAQAREDAVAAKQPRFVRRGAAVVGNPRRRRLGLPVLLQRELPPRERQQIRATLGLGPRFRPVARQKSNATARVPRGDQRPAAPPPLLGRQPGFGLSRGRPHGGRSGLGGVQRRRLQDQVVRRGAHRGGIVHREPQTNAREGHVGDVRRRARGDGGQREDLGSVATLPALLEKLGEKHSGAQPEGEGTFGSKRQPRGDDGVRNRARAFQRLRAQEQSVGLQADGAAEASRS